MNLELKLGEDFSLSSKLDGIPKIIYRTSNNNTDIERDFSAWSITNYQRHDNKYSEKNYLEWKDLILDTGLTQTPEELSFTINVLDAIINWYDNTDEEVCIFCSNDLNFINVKYWPFDWKFLMQQLPYNWDCIQMTGYSPKCLKMHVHPWIQTPGHKCFMITRYFAKRLKHYHYIDNKYKLHYESPNKSIPPEKYGSLDEFFYDLGITYTFPIFSHSNSNIDNTSTSKWFEVCSEGVEYWWKDKSPLYSNFELFNYRKGDDEWKMELQFDVDLKNNPQVYMDSRRSVRIWI